MMYVRFSLSLRTVYELLFKRETWPIWAGRHEFDGIRAVRTRYGGPRQHLQEMED